MNHRFLIGFRFELAEFPFQAWSIAEFGQFSSLGCNGKLELRKLPMWRMCLFLLWLFVIAHLVAKSLAGLDLAKVQLTHRWTCRNRSMGGFGHQKGVQWAGRGAPVRPPGRPG
ncbi:hypothetical protein N7467_008522 [Penicillium canescens]|nr:hypothetical protein N7467_008522 [Penicillium canescens]